MKKFLSLGLLAMCAFALTEHQAHAWVNSKFMIGVNWHHQSGNTSTLWGLWRNGQVPGPEAFGGQAVPAPGMVPPGMYPPGGGSAYPFFGTNGQTPPAAPMGPVGYYGAPQGYQYAAQPQFASPQYPQSLPSGFQTAPPPLNNAVQAQTVSYQPNSYYQPSSYYQPYSYQPNYAYPAYGYQTPYYWYGAR